MFKIAQSSRIFQSPLLRGRILTPFTQSSTKVIDPKSDKAKYLALLQEDLPKPYDGPERDLVNFPRPFRRAYPDKLRMGFLPEEWFQFFHKKTGVTGPYFFGTGLITFLFSKEWFVIEDECSTGVALILLFYIAVKKFGPGARAWADKNCDDALKELEDFKASNVQAMQEAVKQSKKMESQLEATDYLIKAKRENVHMQLETEYRHRMMEVYSRVKKRLDYFLEQDNTRLKMQQDHLVDWVVSNVMKSITPQQEKDALQKCIVDLKGLAAKV